MLLRSLPALFLLLALCALTTHARPTRGTLVSRRLTDDEQNLSNFERLKRGLPPRAPVLNRIIPGREQYRPTRTQKGRRASPSPSPGAVKVYSGRIAVKKDAKSATIGFVKKSDTGVLTVDEGGKAGTDLEVKITITSTSSGPYSLVASSPGKPDFFVGGGSSTTIGARSAAVVPLAGVPQTQPHSAPGPTGASAIWTIDSQTLQLTPVWTNLDASKTRDLTIGYDAKTNTLFFSGDLDAFNDANNSNAVPVELFLTK